MKKPGWARMKIRFYLATCWSSGENDGAYIEGVNWLHDKLLMASVCVHNWFVQPFFEDEVFPYRILEIYEDGQEHGE